MSGLREGNMCIWTFARWKARMLRSPWHSGCVPCSHMSPRQRVGVVVQMRPTAFVSEDADHSSTTCHYMFFSAGWEWCGSWMHNDVGQCDHECGVLQRQDSNLRVYQESCNPNNVGGQSHFPTAVHQADSGEWWHCPISGKSLETEQKKEIDKLFHISSASSICNRHFSGLIITL